MTIGPVEYIIVGFPGNKFSGEIAPELVALVESGTVRILDLIFIGKDADGSVVAFEIDELDEVAGFHRLEGDVGGLISEADIEYAAAALEPNTSAAMLIWEDVWRRALPRRCATPTESCSRALAFHTSSSHLRWRIFRPQSESHRILSHTAV